MIADVKQNKMLLVVLIGCAMPDLFGEIMHFCGTVESMHRKKRHAIIIQDRTQNPRYGGLFADYDHLISLMRPKVPAVGCFDGASITFKVSPLVSPFHLP